MKYSASEIKDYNTFNRDSGQMIRPHCLSGIAGLVLKIKLAVGVITGKYDVLEWK